jgi:hypothetical protein
MRLRRDHPFWREQTRFDVASSPICELVLSSVEVDVALAQCSGRRR